LLPAVRLTEESPTFIEILVKDLHTPES
jgi:hypothetical protein